MSTLLPDLRFSLRLLAKSPGFTAAAVGVLALGIGLNTGMFTVIHGLAFRPRPFAEPDRIAQVYTRDQRQPDRYRLFSYPLWRELQDRRDLFAAVMAFNQTVVGVEEGAATRRAFASIVSANYFDTLGIHLARGRAFTAAEERPGAAAPVVIVSHAHWRKTGFDPGLLGRTLRINERPYTVVGIAPPGFSGTTALLGPEFYFPLGTFALLENFFIGEARRGLERTDAFQLFLVARLAPGIEAGGARAALDALGTNLRGAYPVEFKDQTVTEGPLPRLGTSSSPRSEAAVMVFSGVLMALSGAVLLIVCLNLAGLLLARGQARRKEFAIRLALGAGRAEEQVVGVAAFSSVDFFEESPPGAVYVPFAQGYSGNAHFHVRPATDTPAAALALVPPVRALLHEVAVGVPVFKVSTFKQHAETSVEVWAAGLGSVLLTVFSGFAMVVAVVGIYSVKAYQVSRRTREIGIRMALGAVPSAIQGLILREGLATAALGIAAGLLLGLGANRLISSVMHGVRPFDPLVLLVAASAFLLAAALASWIPARRATRVNPLEALRAE